MKKIGYIFLVLFSIALVSIVAYIIVFGFIKTNFNSSVKQDTDVPIEWLYDYLSDPNYYPAWYSGFLREQRIRGDGFSAGSVSLLYTIDEGENYSSIQKIHEARPPKFIEKEIIHDFYNLKVEIALEKTNDQTTTASIAFQLSGHTFLQRILAPLFCTQVLSEQREMYRKALRTAEDKFPGE